MRTIHKIATARTKPLGEGATVDSPLPSASIRQVSPFLMLDHFCPKDFKPGTGFDVPPHPHRGFEPVTFLFEGAVEHQDSAGNRGLIEGGDIQWMTAGSGVVHLERAQAHFRRSGGRLHLVQLWVNLPKKYKMTAPRYQDIKAKDIPNISTQTGVTLRLIAGEGGAAKTFSPILAIHGQMQPQKTAHIAVPAHFNAMLYVTAGSVQSADKLLETKQLAVFNKDSESVEVRTLDESAEFLLLAGEPIDEPLVSYGPFVMNTPQEIQEAIFDYERGKMGWL